MMLAAGDPFEGLGKAMESMLGGGGGGLGSSTYVVATIFGIIGNLVAFVGAVGACYGAQLPMKLPGNLDATGTPPPPPAK